MTAPRLPRLAWAVLATVGGLCPPAGAKDPPKDKGTIKVREEKEPYAPYKHLLPTDKVIEQYQERLKRNPKDLQACTMLAHLLIRRARETGDFASYDRAGAAARQALKLNKDDVSAQANLAVVLCAQHKFAEGLRLARQLYRKNPTEHALLSIIGDAQLELGEYAAAEKAYRALQKKEPRYSLASRWARLAEIQGQIDKALKHMKRAAEEEINTSITPQGRGWFPFRLGEMYFHSGQLDKAADCLEESLKLNPRYPQALAYLGKVRAGQGKYDEAIKLYVRAAALYPDLSMLADLGDLYAKTGKDFLARLNYDKLEAVGRKQDVYARELSLYYSDHDLKPAEAVALAKKDLEVRKDVYAYDTLAWALCKAKRYKEAAAALAFVLKQGTKDAAVLYHAGMIYAGLGEKDKARSFLRQALQRSPAFSLLQAEKARKTLKGLGDEDSR
jgi:tetratricopeptide (TPR) repeat protein